MKNRVMFSCILFAFCISIAPVPPMANALERDAAPKLVIIIVADQFRYDYLMRFKDDYREGLRQLVSTGAVFTNANFQHYPTYTAVGHAALLTGAYPSITGIVGNQWYDRYEKRLIRAVADASYQMIGGMGGPGASPRNLQVSTVGDELKIATNGRSKVFGISLKDYAGILISGRMADAVFWLDAQSGDFVTSSYFRAELPAWMNVYNAKRPVERYKQTQWRDMKLPANNGPALYSAVAGTPFGNEILEELAEELIRSENLGKGSATDLLIISFSSNDYVGHQHGPDSEYVRDICVSTDRVIGKLLRFVDSHVGLGNVLIVFTSDHGVAPMPETSAAQKMPGGRADLSQIIQTVARALSKEYGEGKWIESVPEEAIYLNWDLIREKNLRYEDVVETAASAALQAPFVFRVYTRHQLLGGDVPDDLVGKRIRRSFSQKRGADLYVLTEPYHIFLKTSTNHGSVFNYDTHVPLILMGPGIRSGWFHSDVKMNDLAPTLSTLLGIGVPSGSEGRILSEVFQGR